MSNSFSNSGKRIPTPVELAAAQNLLPEFFAILAGIGLELVVVGFRAGNDSPIWKVDRIEEQLGRELQSIKAGAFDSSYFPLGAQFHFFRVPAARLGDAVKQIKSALAARGLLEIATIYHAETALEWRQWFPGTAEVLRTDADDETEA